MDIQVLETKYNSYSLVKLDIKVDNQDKFDKLIYKID